MGKRYRRYEDIYVVGSSAAKVERYYELPMQKPEKKVINNKKNIKKEYILKSNPMYTFVLVSVIMATLAMCIVLMKAQFTVTESSVFTRKLQSELNEIKSENAQLEAGNKEAVNLEEIYRIATEDLGMILPQINNVEYVEVEPVTYTKQFSEISTPKEEGVSVGNVLGIISKGW